MSKVLGRIADEICARYLAPYVARMRLVGSSHLEAKQVHDSLWGTIPIKALEVAILDSPLLQRLRHLRQLGVAHWVYPGADHSRFEHSLGVLYQTQQLIAAVNRAGAAKYGVTVIDADDAQALRVAALMHDIGHPVLSHVSEYALRIDATMLLEVQRERKGLGENVSVSELVAANIVRSEPFKQLLEAVGASNPHAGGNANAWKNNPAQFADRVAKIILGQHVSERIPLLHELVSGPYDADKLDYMVRDPRAAGIPAIIDMSRLVQKLTVQRREESQLPEVIGKHVPQGTREVFLFGFPWSGISVVDELLLGRMMLYSKLYRHPKVAALEAMVKSLIDQLYLLVGSEKVVSFVYDVLDDQLVLASRSTLLAQLGLEEQDVQDAERQRALEVAVDLLRRLRERELFVRAFAFFPGQPNGEEDPISDKFDQIIKSIDNAAKAATLHANIIERTREILKACGEPEDSFRYRNADKLIVLRKLEPPSQKELRHAWIFPTGGEPKTFEKIGIHKEAWSSSFVSASAKGYVLAPKDLAKAALLATETVIAETYGIAVPEWMLEETKHSQDTLRKTKLELRTAGFYGNKPPLIRPRQERLRMNDVEKAVTAFVDRFGAVQETVAEVGNLADNAFGASTLKDRTYAWLDQFDQDEHIDCALELLSKAKLVGRNDVVNAVRSFIEDHKEFATASVISLDKGNDSSQIVQYFTADAGPGLRFYGSPEEAAREGRSDPIIIVDDFCGTGNQWSNIIGSAFGLPEAQKPELNEQRTLVLEPVREYLRNRDIAFVFTGGWEDGRKAVLDAAAAAGLNVKVHIHVTEEHLPFAEQVLKGSHVAEHTESFLAKAAEIGDALLRSRETDWDESKFEQRKLGYGNRGMLLFFPYNAPSQTMTFMWSDGTFDGRTWLPLIRRRKKSTGSDAASEPPADPGREPSFSAA
ncbi:HD domain-containing protein [Sphingomonas sp. ST-64]|uniref:HD domain-containing protein n=1 Tax=Sphingomonas plantiphila TaxID=3163295 RepID=A0ABW8YKL4_9SPHN